MKIKVGTRAWYIQRYWEEMDDGSYENARFILDHYLGGTLN